MTATQRTTGSGGDSAGGSLGDLLYAGVTKERISEDEWVALVRAIGIGDQRALRALYDRTHRLVFTLIVRLVNDRRSAEELTLDVFYEAWRRAGSYDPAGGSVVGWMMNLARSRAIDRLRYEQRKKRTAPPPADDPGQAGNTEGGAEALEAMQQAQALRERLQVLAPDEREAIETAFFLELTYPEAAARLRQPLGTVKTRIRSGLEKLRQALTPQREEP